MAIKLHGSCIDFFNLQAMGRKGVEESKKKCYAYMKSSGRFESF
jgi:hypothetical protein